jgi:hypothetical protein
MLLSWPVQAQPLAPDQACATIVRTLDDATGHRDSNREALRRALIACRLFATGTPSPAAPADPLADIEPSPRGITRAEVEAAIADWCSTHMQAPLCPADRRVAECNHARRDQRPLECVGGGDVRRRRTLAHGHADRRAPDVPAAPRHHGARLLHLRDRRRAENEHVGARFAQGGLVLAIEDSPCAYARGESTIATSSASRSRRSALASVGLGPQSAA